MVSLLLEFGANVDAECDRGMTALCHAAAGGHLEIVRMLFIKKSKVGLRLIQVLNCFMARCNCMLRSGNFSFALTVYYFSYTGICCYGG